MTELDITHYYEFIPGTEYPVQFRSRITWPDQCVYLLWHWRRLVYVGTTVNLKKRLGKHYRGEGKTSRKVFDRVTWVASTDADYVAELETELVNRFKPVHNRTPDGKMQRGRPRRAVADLEHWYS